MRVVMLISTIRKYAPYNLRRIAACITYRNKTATKIVRYQCNESKLLSTSLPSLATCRIYSTKLNQPQVSLPMLVDGASTVRLYFPYPYITRWKLHYSVFHKIMPHIDIEFNLADFLKGAKYAVIMISKALANKNYESLQGLVTEDMIQILSTKIETLSPNQRQLIAVNEDDVMDRLCISDIAVTTGKEHSIEIKTTCIYTLNLAEKRTMGWEQVGLSNSSLDYFVCDYKFIRKYVNNAGGPWITTFVNHYSVLYVKRNNYWRDYLRNYLK